VALRNQVRESSSCGIELGGIRSTEACRFWMADEMAEAVVVLAIEDWRSGSRGGNAGCYTRASGGDASRIALALRHQVGKSSSRSVEFGSVSCTESTHFWVADKVAKAVIGLAIHGW
jgi:hypothetical protein